MKSRIRIKRLNQCKASASPELRQIIREQIALIRRRRRKR